MIGLILILILSFYYNKKILEFINLNSKIFYLLSKIICEYFGKICFYFFGFIVLIIHYYILFILLVSLLLGIYIIIKYY